MQEIEINSLLEKRKIHGVFFDAVKPKANVILVHGMAEYALRYLDFINFLVKNDFNVFAVDHLGHGMQVSKVEGARLGVVSKDSFDKNVEQIYALNLYIQQQNNLPIYIFGHSMGSFISQAYYQRHSETISGLILCGSGFNNFNYRLGYFLTSIMSIFYKGNKGYKISRFLVNSANHTFNKGISKKEYNNSSARWISYSKENIKEYEDDKFTGFDCSFNFYYALFHGQQNIWKKRNRNKITHKVPMYLIAGADDPVGDYSKGIDKLYNFYNVFQPNLVTKTIYPHARHEILNEDIKEEVKKDILTFLNSLVDKK